MLIPVRCVTCGDYAISTRWLAYQALVEKEKKKDGRTDSSPPYLTKSTVKTAEGRAMDQLGFTRECCRRHILTSVELL
jgi:DNA-directed RNA polymerase subunit N (RpoN/RPB10)